MMGLHNYLKYRFTKYNFLSMCKMGKFIAKQTYSSSTWFIKSYAKLKLFFKEKCPLQH